MKQPLFIVLSLLSFHIVFAEPSFDFSTLVGTYQGHPFDIENGEQDKETEVTAELSAAFIFYFNGTIEGKELRVYEKLIPQSASVSKDGSIELKLEVVDTNSVFATIYFSLLPPSQGYGAVFISFKESENKFLSFQMNREGGNPLIPGAAEGLTGRELETALHQQFEALFSDLENGFNLGDQVEKEGYTLYSSDLYLTHTIPGYINIRDSGVSYYIARIKEKSGEDKWAYRDSLIQAIESYPSSAGFRVEEVAREDAVKIYALTKFREPYGFVEFKEDEKGWLFRVFIPLDTSRLKEELVSGLEMSKKNFREIQGDELEEFTFIEGETAYESKRIFYGADISKINRFESRTDWTSGFAYYPYAVLVYQLQEMDLKLTGIRKTEDKETEKGYFQRFEMSDIVFAITLEKPENGMVRLWISKNKNSNPTGPIAPVKTYAANREYPAFSGQYEGDELYELMGRHWDDPAIKKWLNTPEYGFKKSRTGDSEYCVYDASGIWLTFIKSHLAKIQLFDSDMISFGTFNGELPKALRWESTIPSINSGPISWYKKHNQYEIYGRGEGDGITTKIKFTDPNEPDKLSGIEIRKPIIADAREDILKDEVGVGLGYSDNNAGMISVNNSQSGYAAYKAGIHEGMWLLEIDGTPLQGKNEYRINKLLKGKLGSAVRVKFCRRYEEENAKEAVLYRGAGGKAEVEKAVASAKSQSISMDQYDGDGLFQLLGQDFSDPVITAFIRSSDIKKINIGTDPNRQKMNGKGIGLEFYNNTLIKVSLSPYGFEGTLPLGLKFGSSPAEVKKGKQLKWADQGNPYITTDYKEHIELRIDFDENTYVAGAQSTFIYLTLKPKKVSLPDSADELAELGFHYSQGKDSDIYEVWLKESSPAYKAGMRMDDNVLKINGTAITGMDSDDVKKVMLGKKGTTAIVVVERDGIEIECKVVR